MTTHTVSSSSGMVLTFPTHTEFEEYNKEMHDVEMRAYERLREKHGIWATNQGKYVKTTADLNSKRGDRDWGDSWFMEETYAKWKKNNA